MGWVQSKGNTGAATTLACTFTTANVSAGNTYIAVVSQDHNVTFTPSSVKNGAGNSFVQIGATALYASSQGGLSVWALNVPAGDVGTKPTITATVSATFGISMVVQEVSGIITATTSAGFSDVTLVTNTGAASPATSAAYSTSGAGKYVLAAAGDAGSSQTYTETGYTADSGNPAANGDADCQVGYINSSTSGSQAFSWAITGATNWGTALVAFKPAATTTGGPPVHVVEPNLRRRRGISKFIKGPINPVPVPLIRKVQRFPLRLPGVSKFLRGPVNPVPVIPVTVVNTHRPRKGRILFLRGPVNPVAEPNITVVATHRRRRGVIQYLRGTTPGAVIPANVTVVTPTHTRRRGVSKFLKGPVNPVLQVPVVVVNTHRRRRGISKFLVGPVNPVPVPAVKIVQRYPGRHRATVQYVRGVTPTGPAPVPVPPVTVVTPTHRLRRGIAKFLAGPVNPTAVPSIKIVQRYPLRRRGTVEYVRGGTPAAGGSVALPAVTVVTPTHTRRRGIVRFLKGIVSPVLQPPVVVANTHRRRTGRVLYVKGPTAAVPVPHVRIVQQYPPRRRATLRYAKGATLPPPPFSVGFLNSVDAPGGAGGVAYGYGNYGDGTFSTTGVGGVLEPGEGLVHTGNYGDGGYGDGMYGFGPELVYGTLTGAPTIEPQSTLSAGEDFTYLGAPYGGGAYGSGAYGHGTVLVFGGIVASARAQRQSTLTGSSA